MTSSRRSYSSPMRRRFRFLSAPAGRLIDVAAAGFFEKGRSHSAIACWQIAASMLSRLTTVAALYFSACRSRKPRTDRPVEGVRSRPEGWQGYDPCDHCPVFASPHAHSGRPVHGRFDVLVAAYPQTARVQAWRTLYRASAGLVWPWRRSGGSSFRPRYACGPGTGSCRDIQRPQGADGLWPGRFLWKYFNFLW